MVYPITFSRKIQKRCARLNDASRNIDFTENYGRNRFHGKFVKEKKIHQISHKKNRQIDELKGNFFSTR